MQAISKKPPHRAASLSKKSACGGLFRQKLKKCLRPGAQTPRPPGKAGRYEFTLEDLRVLQTSPNGLFDSLTAPQGGKANRKKRNVGRV